MFCCADFLFSFSMIVSFRGGLEDFMSAADAEIPLSSLRGRKIKDLILHVDGHVMHQGYKHFSKDGELEGGILCVVNEQDWEVLAGEDTELSETDHLYFISSMHGG